MREEEYYNNGTKNKQKSEAKEIFWSVDILHKSFALKRNIAASRAEY
jgi:hypothetical protein